MSKQIWIAVIAIIIIIAGVWYFQNSKPEAAVSGESIKIAVSTMLSGNWSSLGDNIVMAAKLAVEDINKSGGINGRPVELVIQDSGLDSKTGLAAAQKLINTDSIKYIIGGTSSNGTMAAAPLVNDKKVVYLTPVTGGTNIDNAGEYIFRTANSDLLAGRDLALAAFKLNYKKVAVVSEVTEYTLDIEKTFKDTLSGQGGVVAVSEQFQPGTTDFRTIVAKVKASNPDAILILSQTGVSGAHFIKQAKEAGVAKPLLSDFTFVANADAQKIVVSFDGIYFADPAYGSDKSKTKAFFSRYEKTFGSPSVIPFHAASTYDSVMMLADALRASGDDSVKVHDWLLSNVKNWQGLMGTYSLDSNGNSDLGFVMKIVKNGQFVKLEE
jgi:branched-chain amino acid transport system substrate-binding protein